MVLKMNASKKLENVKNSIFGSGGGEQNQIYNLCAVMEIVGGYTQLMNLPLPAFAEVIKYLEFLNKQANKSMPKMKGK